MKDYSLLRSLPLAFYSQLLYRDVGQQWRGWGLLYLWLLSAVCSLPYTYRIYENIIVPYAHAAQPLVAQLPRITITQGIVSIDKPAPYFIKDPKSERVLAIIDTTGATNSLEHTTALALLTKDKLVTKQGGVDKIYTIPTSKNTTYTPAGIERLLYYASYWLVVVVYLLAILIYYLLSLISVLLYAGVVRFFIDTGFSYKALVRLAAVAVTPVFILAAALQLFGFQLPYRWVIYVLLSLGYLLYGVKANWQKD